MTPSQVGTYVAIVDHHNRKEGNLEHMKCGMLYVCGEVDKIIYNKCKIVWADCKTTAGDIVGINVSDFLKF